MKRLFICLIALILSVCSFAFAPPGSFRFPSPPITPRIQANVDINERGIESLRAFPDVYVKDHVLWRSRALRR